MSKSKALAPPLQHAQGESLAFTASELRMVNAFRALSAGEPRNFVLRYTEALRAKLVPPERSRLALV